MMRGSYRLKIQTCRTCHLRESNAFGLESLLKKNGLCMRNLDLCIDLRMTAMMGCRSWYVENGWHKPTNHARRPRHGMSFASHATEGDETFGTICQNTSSLPWKEISAVAAGLSSFVWVQINCMCNMSCSAKPDTACDAMFLCRQCASEDVNRRMTWRWSHQCLAVQGI